MKTKTILKLLLVFFILPGSFSSCKDKSEPIDMSKIDFSNIEDLHSQPLPVIQKCVEGEWKCIEIIVGGYVGAHDPINTLVNITNDSVVVTGDDSYIPADSFSYRWEKKKTSRGYTTYVMWDNGQNAGRWFFDSIRNDNLVVIYYSANEGISASYLFLKIY